MNTDKPDVTVLVKTVKDPNTEHVYNTIVYNANELNHGRISERVDYLLSELSNYLKSYSGDDKENAVTGFFKTFDKELTFDRGPYKMATPIKLVAQPGGKITRRKSNRKKSKRRKSKSTRKI
jgi:hypothetical protein